MCIGVALCIAAGGMWIEGIALSGGTEVEDYTSGIEGIVKGSKGWGAEGVAVSDL